MRSILLIKLLLIIVFSQNISAANIGAPAAPDQPVVVQDGLLAKISWTTQAPNTDAFISQSVNGSVWTSGLKVPFQHYDAPIELGKSYSFRIMVCNSDGVSIEPPPNDTTSYRSLNTYQPLSRNSPTSRVISTITNTADLTCSEWSSPSNIINVPSLQVQTPVISPRNIEITDATTVTLNPTEPGVTVRYVINGNEVNENSPIFPANLVVNSSLTISLKAFKAGYANSNVGTYYFTKISSPSTGGTSLLQVQTPVISPRNVEITDATTVTLNPTEPGVTVRYVINGNEVNENSPIFPTSLVVNSSLTISLKAFKNGYASSNVGTYYFSKISISPSAMKFKYDSLGRLIKVEDSSGNSVEYVLDNAGNRVKVK